MAKSQHRERLAKVARLLKETRLKAGMTQQDLADKLGRSQSFVAKYEGNERRLDVVEFVVICTVLKVRLKDVAIELENICRNR